MSGRMHPDEIALDAPLVAGLIAGQFLHWSGLPVVAVSSAGTDNALFRLGEGLVVRLPRIASAVESLARELRWLPWLGERLPVPVPRPVAVGEPAAGFPFRWAVYEWLPGSAPVACSIDLALDVAGFVRALRDVPVPVPDGSVRGDELPRSYRGGRLADRDADTRQFLPRCAGLIDTELATRMWQAALELPEYGGPPRWFHGDLKPDNLLASSGRLAAVLDFGGVAVGDPAVDQLFAWDFLTGEARAAFRSSLGADEAEWLRGRAWALTVGVVALGYYRSTNPGLAAVSRFQIEQALADFASNG